MSVLVVAALSLVTPAAPIPPPPPSPHQCGAANCTFDLELDTTTGIPWVLGDFAVRQTNCVFLDRRFWCFADVVPFASPQFPNTYNTSTHLFSATAADMIFRYEHEVVPRGPPGAWDHGGAQTPGAAIAADGTVVVVYCGFAAGNSSANSNIGVAVAPHPNATFVKLGRIASTVEPGANHADPQLLLQPHTGELLLYHRRSGGQGYSILRSRQRAGDQWTAFGDPKTVLAADPAPGPGVRAREAIDGKYLVGRNRTVLISDEFFWPMNGPMVTAAFMSDGVDASNSSVLCAAAPAVMNRPGFEPYLALVTLLQDGTGAITHAMLGKKNTANKGYGPVVYKVKSPAAARPPAPPARLASPPAPAPAADSAAPPPPLPLPPPPPTPPSYPPTMLDIPRLDCSFRRLVLAQARALQPFRTPADFAAIADSLEMPRLCGDPRLPAEVPPPPPASPRRRADRGEWATLVDPRRGDDLTGRAGVRGSPFATIAAALDAVRAARAARLAANAGVPPPPPQPSTIELASGLHHLAATMELGPADSYTRFVSAPAGMAWISGGRLISAASWKPALTPSGAWEATLDASWGRDFDVTGLFTTAPHTRLTKARYPNGNVETTPWGYASPTRVDVSINASAVLEWHKPAAGTPPTFTVVDLADPANPTGFVKNDSSMGSYNVWTVGTGGVCDSVWNAGEPSYWCSNASDGGWANVDAAAATEGRLNLPIGMTINTSYPGLARIKAWENASGAIVHAWHSQSWATHMFRVSGRADSADASEDSVTFAFAHGGQQGGRNWCRCDQCSYAALWCGQHKTPPDNTDARLISGSWYVEGVAKELDRPGEWFFDPTSRSLVVWPNITSPTNVRARPNPPGNIVVPVLKTLVSISNGGTGAETAVGITFDGIGFRDSVATYMAKEWSAPSGGDWSLFHGGAVSITAAANVTVTGCHFRRLDGNAIYLPGRSRDVVVEKSAFEWLGENAVAANGDTEQWDARGGDQPRSTVVTENVMHDLGLYEKQSSGWAQNKACLATVSKNIMYNLPRAAINFNDALGGGNLIDRNLLWNICRESGDHGPINSWNRMPFLHDLGPDGRPSFTPLPTEIVNNYIIANFGGSQGVDNDDGSSHFHTHDNVFYMSDGFKMDYGGHDSSFHDNLIVNYPYDGQRCLNLGGGFEAGHGDAFYNNTCVVGIGGTRKPSGCGDPSCFPACAGLDPFRSSCGLSHAPAVGLDHVGTLGSCDPSRIKSSGNRYFSPNGNATVDCSGHPYSIADAQALFKVELGSTAGPLPTDDEIVGWAKEKLGL